MAYRVIFGLQENELFIFLENSGVYSLMGDGVTNNQYKTFQRSCNPYLPKKSKFNLP